MAAPQPVVGSQPGQMQGGYPQMPMGRSMLTSSNGLSSGNMNGMSLNTSGGIPNISRIVQNAATANPGASNVQRSPYPSDLNMMQQQQQQKQGQVNLGDSYDLSNFPLLGSGARVPSSGGSMSRERVMAEWI
eukprot:TRINITY_DN3177_c0_g1_i4.p1 TRINITY_DN3177_c0_g1~~TRINITY_DN3177_c0_g1_i4.p1  ORF type:complete len:132 (+),score=19.10 TRINITY_DN3177_c0_g1_i4:374-769(+)